MNKKLKVTLKVLDNVASKYPDTKNYIEENIKEVCEWEGLTVEEVVYFVVGLYPMSSCLSVFERIDELLFHVLESRKMIYL